MNKLIRFPNQNRKPRKSRDRLPFLFSWFLIGLMVIAGRLVFIQAVKAEKLDRMAKVQRSKTINLAADRGTIYDRNGEILAISMDMDTIFATPYLVKKPRKTAGQLAKLLGEDASAIHKKLVTKSGFVYIKRKVKHEIAEKIKRLELPGIEIVPESQRFYPGKTIANHVLGFVGLDNNGLAGIELAIDSYLRGRPGKLEMERDPYGRPIPGGKYRLTKATHGRDLFLTIDKEIQYKAQVELKKAVKKWEAAAGWAVVMDSGTGDIYALANEPTYDLNKFALYDPGKYPNKVVSDVYEPGSTMKVVTVAAAMEEGLYAPSSVFVLPGTKVVGGHTVREAHPRGTETFTLTEIISRSSNVGAVTIGQALGKERLFRYVGEFGLNQPTNINLPGESVGYLPPTQDWSASSIATIPFGQGLNATALEMVRAINVVAADGRMIEPRIISRISGKLTQGGKARQVISAKTAEAMAEMMRLAVAEGTGGEARIPNYQVAGKTGTAQKPRSGAPGYDPGKYISSFIGFAPVDKPALTILVALDEPKGQYYGGVVAAPAFNEIGRFALQRLKVSPDGQ